MGSRVSVLIPTYNCPDMLPETLDSILSQTYAPAEVIVVDDGSTDNTREVVARFGKRVTYQFVENGGICRARNIAASLARSPYLAFCDHDDLWRPDKLAQQMELHDRNPGLQYSFTNFSPVIDGIWATGTKLDDAPSNFFAGIDSIGTCAFEYPHSLYDRVLEFQPIWPSTIVISREFFNRLQGFREQFGKNPSEDLEFTLRCVQQPPTGVVPQPVVGVRKHSSNYSGDTYRNTRGQIEILQYVLHHHTMNETTRSLVLKQIGIRRVEASYSAFRRGEFQEVVSLLSRAPRSCIDSKARLKYLISRLPLPLARRAHRALLRS
jgi:glycosyltransferase involved in cell wall biosynthesis